ncbi:dihydroorotate dehydrogenase electron transfer subunit [Candidatus Woesearchaeota archaeon]|nr:dihydroorotate dehydrogenase electron transfer subunit [Candidatus Woesearchaeota archaeon]
MERPLERPEIVEITKSVDEAEGIKTIFLKSDIKAKPGQFVMVWIPRLDEKPFAISYSNKGTSGALINPTGEIGITVAAVGPFSNKLYAMNPGEKVGVRGPYGTTYRLEGKKIVMVGGGYGSASLTMLAEEALQQGIKVKFILGARTKSRLVYAEQIKKLIGTENLIITTDDGSAGMKGLVTDALKQLLHKEKIDKIFACGPDKMLKAVADIGSAAHVKGEVSMERWFKCGGMGICGHCCVDPIGIRLCVEGPVIDFETAAKITELGEYHRLKSSRKEKI